LAGAGKSMVKIPQRIGRVLRTYPGKENAVVIDFYDNCTYLLGHSQKRLKIYKKEPEFTIKINVNKTKKSS
jgi:superfamily II DNA or RNA helicase